jgi:tetratricopeptide (TPR) repeat protein
MRNRKLPLIASVLVALFGASVVLACGDDFPWDLLTNRAATLDTMPINNTFAYAAARLAPSPKDDLHAIEPEFTEGDTGPGTLADALTQAETAGLSSSEAATLQQVRAETSGDQAYNKGELLPASVRLYTAGAVDFHKGDANKAIARFQKVLNLPAGDRRDREVWAAYMLGRLYGSKHEVAKASKSFELTRDFVSDGTPDPLGLAVASYGEEARLHLDRARELQKSKKRSAKQLQKYGHEIASATALYAEQAAHGSKIGIDSLRMVTDEVLGDDATIEASICDPTVQQLLVDRLLADNAGPPEADSGGSQLSQVVSATQKCRDQHLDNADQLAAIAYRAGDYHLAQRLVARATGPLAYWVRARLAMQQGNIAEAAKDYVEASKAFPASTNANSPDAGIKAFVTGQNTVLTLSRGEYVDALEQLYPYVATFWADVAYLAERVLTVDELKTFVDIHTDAQVQPVVSRANLPSPFGSNSEGAENQSATDNGPATIDKLRDLLARRLVRAGRYQEALNYAPALEVNPSTPAGATSSPAAVSTVSPVTAAESGVWQTQTIGTAAGSSPASTPTAWPLTITQVGRLSSAPKSLAVPEPRPHMHRHRHRRNISAPPNDAIAEYVQALNDANTARSEVDRARALYRAAAMAGDFGSGAKIMGTGGPPDFVDPFAFGLGTDDQFVSKGERQRYNDSAPKPDFRYHYIFVGADEAIRAAALLPPRSQAFAAVLCNATSWMIDGKSCPASAADLRTSLTAYGSTTANTANPLTLDVLWVEESNARINLSCQLYQRYLKAGAVVTWATDFGRDCPEPDFASAIDFVQVQEIREARRRTQMIHHRWLVLFQLALVAACLGASTWWFLRHRYV